MQMHIYPHLIIRYDNNNNKSHHSQNYQLIYWNYIPLHHQLHINHPQHSAPTQLVIQIKSTNNNTQLERRCV